jgi:predicted dehydrogenase
VTIKFSPEHGIYEDTSGAGAADPKAIDFLWHQRNFENALHALKKGEKPAVDGMEGRRAVELITAIYESIQNGGNRVQL